MAGDLAFGSSNFPSDMQFFPPSLGCWFLFSGVPQASAGVGHAFAFAVQALVTLGGALL